MIARLGKPNWTFAVVELVIVIVGILLALAFDDLRQGRADSAERAAWVSEVRQELVSDTAQLRQVADFQVTLTALVEQLLEAADAQAWPADRGSIGAALRGASFARFRPSADPYKDLEASGRLSLMLDQTTRRRLRRYYELAEGTGTSVASDIQRLAVQSLDEPHWRLFVGPPSFMPGTEGGPQPAPGETEAILTLLGQQESVSLLRLLLAEAEVNQASIGSLLRLAQQVLDGLPE